MVIKWFRWESNRQDHTNEKGQVYSRSSAWKPLRSAGHIIWTLHLRGTRPTLIDYIDICSVREVCFSVPRKTCMEVDY